MNDNCITKEPSLPVFRELIDAFENVSNALNENSNVICNRVNAIREKSEPENEKLKSNPPSTVVEELWQQISKLRDTNYKLSQTRENLEELVG